MPDLLQGAALPATISGEQTQTTVPEFYSNYLQDVTNLGQNAVTQGGVAGLSPLQQQALNMAPETSFAGAGSLGTAQDMLTQAGYTGAPELASAYMNPFNKYVTDEMGRLVQRGISETVLPGIEAGAIASGNFGSQRQANITGQALRDISTDLYGRQMKLLGDEYQQAIQNAQTDLGRGITAGTALGNLGQTQQNVGTGALKTLADLGSMQQKQAQTELDYPMQQAKFYSGLLGGQQIPTGSVKQTIEPGTTGNFQNSPLMQLTQLAAVIQAVMNGGSPQEVVAAFNPSSSSSTLGKAEGGVIESPDDSEMGEGGLILGNDGYVYDSFGNQVG